MSTTSKFSVDSGCCTTIEYREEKTDNFVLSDLPKFVPQFEYQVHLLYCVFTIVVCSHFVGSYDYYRVSSFSIKKFETSFTGVCPHFPPKIKHFVDFCTYYYHYYYYYITHISSLQVFCSCHFMLLYLCPSPLSTKKLDLVLMLLSPVYYYYIHTF